MSAIAVGQGSHDVAVRDPLFPAWEPHYKRCTLAPLRLWKGFMMADQNFKGQLINRCIKKGMTYDFPEISVEGPSHDHRFLFHAIVNGEKLGEGKHETKKGAENIAAKMALAALHAQEQSSPSAPQNPSQSPQLDHSSSELNTSTEESSSSISCDTTENTLEINYVGRLNELRQKKKWQRLIFSDRQEGRQHIPEFFCNVIIGDRHFPETTGKNKSEAKRNAAFLALQILKNENPDDSEIPDLNGSFGSESASGYSTPERSSENVPSSSESKDSVVFSSNLTPAGPTKPLSTEESSSSISCDTTENTLEINYVGKLNELRQKKKWQRLIFLDRQEGPPHIPEFFCNVIIGDRQFPETAGKNKSEAKRNAAFLALQILKKENPDDSEIPDLNGSFGSESASGYSTPEKRYLFFLYVTQNKEKIYKWFNILAMKIIHSVILIML
uniref:DRBM domain-containing protein n=1 Tax=Leptobrachium leishanense TaxID=445787 RepID=A0A8C5PVX0_9ANUR